jgi:hypothetical protein
MSKVNGSVVYHAVRLADDPDPGDSHKPPPEEDAEEDAEEDSGASDLGESSDLPPETVPTPAAGTDLKPQARSSRYYENHEIAVLDIPMDEADTARLQELADFCRRYATKAFGDTINMEAHQRFYATWLERELRYDQKIRERTEVTWRDRLNEIEGEK